MAINRKPPNIVRKYDFTVFISLKSSLGEDKMNIIKATANTTEK